MKKILLLFISQISLLSVGYAQKFLTGLQNDKFLKNFQGIQKDANGDFILANGVILKKSYGIKEFFKNTTLANDFWTKDGEEIIKNTFISAGLSDSTGLVFTDFYADLIGPVKISIASSLSANKDKVFNTAQTFLMGGGNFIIKGDLPLKVYGNSLRNFTLLANSRFGCNVPVIGNTSSRLLYYGNMETQGHFLLMGDKQNLGLVGKFQYGVFFTNLGQVNNVVIINDSKLNDASKKSGWRFGGSLGIFLPKIDLVVSIDFPERFTAKSKSQAKELPPYLSVTRQVWLK